MVAAALASERERRASILLSFAVAIAVFPAWAMNELVRDIVSFLEADIVSLPHTGLWLAGKLRALVVDRLDCEQTAEWRIMLS
jgi:hypothetical protein